MKATNKQIGGSHYKDMPIQPVEFIHKNGIPFIEGCVIKYVSRWRNKGGVEDLKKARHFLDLLIEVEEAKETIDPLCGGEDYTITQRAWPEKYEVGMRFRRKDGEISCVCGVDCAGAEMDCDNDERWWYAHGERRVHGFERKYPEAELIEYLGKD